MEQQEERWLDYYQLEVYRRMDMETTMLGQTTVVEEKERV